MSHAQHGTRPEIAATVIDLLPNAVFRLRLDDRREVLAHSAGPGRKNFVRVRPGDRVQVVLAPSDPGRGRITRLLTKS